MTFPRGQARFSKAAGDRRPRGHRLQTPLVAASAEDTVGAGHPHMAQVAGRARAPRCRTPPKMMPAPMPVPTFTKTRSSTSGRWACRSPSAMMLTSLSMRTGTLKARRVCAVRRTGPSPA